MLAQLRPYEVVRQPFGKAFIEATESQLSQLQYRAAPSWLGGFGFRMFDGPYEKKTKPPTALLTLCAQLARLVPTQSFNTTFAQKYQIGQAVKTHRDPKSNIGKTVIFVVGDFEGAETTIENEKIQLKRGDALILSCFENGKQGPPHSVSAVTKGVKYSLILNTIVAK